MALGKNYSSNEEVIVETEVCIEEFDKTNLLKGVKEIPETLGKV